MSLCISSAHDTFPVTHLDTGDSYQRTNISRNKHHSATVYGSKQPPDPSIEDFHKKLPRYAPTPLISLPDLATELGVAHVFVKDESLRFGLPSFKILGASWAVYRALCSATHLPPTCTLDEVGAAARRAGVKLVTCSAGNWGRAVARMGHYMGVDVKVFVFRDVSNATINIIRRERAIVVQIDGSYDDSIAKAVDEGKQEGNLLVMDTSMEGFEEIPRWVVEGYSTMLTETDRQIEEACGRVPIICIVPVGVGSLAQAVVAHYTPMSPDIQNITVEPESAPCLMESLCMGKLTTVETRHTIMPGMNCGTVSSLAWPVLKAGVHTSVAVNDVESHTSVEYLNAHGVNAGPCGASTLVAARQIHRSGFLANGSDTVLVLFNT